MANVSLLDVFPTILDLALAGRPPIALADPIDGHSLLPMLHLGNQGSVACALSTPPLRCLT